MHLSCLKLKYAKKNRTCVPIFEAGRKENSYQYDNIYNIV